MAEFLTTAGISYNFQELKNCKVYCFENLHAKCYLNENSQRNNREMRIEVKKETDQKLYNEVK